MDEKTERFLEAFRQARPTLQAMLEFTLDYLKKLLAQNNIMVTAVEGRVKTIGSLAGKLDRKGMKYKKLSDLTDLVGMRVVTFYSDEVDKIAALVESHFDIDWENSIDKRKLHAPDHFGYMSLHYICRIPRELFSSEDFPMANEFRFELQMRTALQHVWATVYHDTGYKSDIEMPSEYIRPITRMAVILEIADEEFCKIRTDLENYRRRVKSLVENGDFNAVPLDGDSFSNYMELQPFRQLLERIASCNNAEIHPTNPMRYLKPLRNLGFQTLGDLEKMKQECSEDAYKLAVRQLSITDLDIIASTLAIQNLCLVHIVKADLGEVGLRMFYEALHGPSESNAKTAKRTFALVSSIIRHENI